MKSNLVFVLLLTSLTISAQIGLEGYYPFSGNADDYSGNDNHGTVYGAVLTTDRFGNVNSAYKFDGEEDYIDLGNNFNLTSHSLSVWFKMAYIPTENWMVFISTLNNGPFELQNFEMRADSYVSYFCGTGSIWDTGVAYILPDTIDWHHVVSVYNDTLGMAYLYFDGLLVDSTTTTLATSTDPDLFVGARPYWSGAGGPAFHFAGKLDDIGIFDRTITADEVDSMYTAGVISDICEPTTALEVSVLSSTAAEVSWDAVDGATQYVFVLRDNTTGERWTRNTTETYMYLGALTAGHSYTTRIRTNCYPEGMSSPSGQTDFTTPLRLGAVDGGLSIYPNPNDGNFRLQLNGYASSDMQVQIMNTVGQVVYNSNFYVNDDITVQDINLSTVESGTYIVRISNGVETFIQTLIIE